MSEEISGAQKIQQVCDRYDQIEEKIQSTLSSHGVSDEADRPGEIASIAGLIVMKGKVPSLGDITSASDPQIGALHGYFTDWSVYLSVLGDKVTRIHDARKAKLAAVVMELKKFLKKELKVKATDIQMEVETYRLKEEDLPLYVQLHAALLEAKSVKTSVENRYKDYKSIAHAVSREQSRRASDFKSQSRSFNMTKSPTPTNGGSRW